MSSPVSIWGPECNKVPVPPVPGPDPVNIELPPNGSDLTEGGLFEASVFQQVARLAQPYIPGTCIFEMAGQAQTVKTQNNIFPTVTGRSGTQLLPFTGIHTFSPESPALLSGALFDAVEVTVNSIVRFRFVGKYPTYAHLKGSIRMHKRIGGNPAVEYPNLSDATLRLNPATVSGQLPLEARGQSNGRAILSYSGATLMPKGEQVRGVYNYNIPSPTYEFDDKFLRWRVEDEEANTGVNIPVVEYIDNMTVSTSGALVAGTGGRVAKFDVSNIAAKQLLRILVLGQNKVSSVTRAAFYDANDELIRIDPRNFMNRSAKNRVIVMPDSGATTLYLYFKTSYNTATEVDLAEAKPGTLTEQTFYNSGGLWGQYVFEVDRPVIFYPGVVYCIDIYAGGRDGFRLGIFNNSSMRIISGSLSFDFNAYPYLKDKGIVR